MVLILLIVGGLFLWKRSRRNKVLHDQIAIGSDKVTTANAYAPTNELPQTEAMKYEAYGTSYAELHHHSSPTEMLGELPRTQRQGR